MFKTAGVKGNPLMLLMTDGQIVDDHFLISINAILANGWVSDLFAKDEVDQLLGGLRNEAKAAGVTDTPESMMDFLIQRVKVRLRMGVVKLFEVEAPIAFWACVRSKSPGAKLFP